MKVTPLDIDQQQFQRVFRGCDAKEVHSFLDLVSRQLEELIRENSQLKTQIHRKDDALSEYRKHEVQLREALVAAGRLTDDVREGARKEADIIRAEAQMEAEQIVKSTHEQVVTLSAEVRALQQQRIRLVSELESVLLGHTRLIETYEVDA